MNCDIELNEIKLHLKQWEINFFKENGRKPRKTDIKNNKDVENLYAKYAKMKKRYSCLDKNVNSQVNISTSQEVWGSNLLKANSTIYDIDDHLNRDENLHCQSTSVSPLSYQKTIRNNLRSVQVKNLPLNLKKYKRNITRSGVIPIIRCSTTGYAPSINTNSRINEFTKDVTSVPIDKTTVVQSLSSSETNFRRIMNRFASTSLFNEEKLKSVNTNVKNEPDSGIICNKEELYLQQSPREIKNNSDIQENISIMEDRTSPSLNTACVFNQPNFCQKSVTTFSVKTGIMQSSFYNSKLNSKSFMNKHISASLLKDECFVNKSSIMHNSICEDESDNSNNKNYDESLISMLKVKNDIKLLDSKVKLNNYANEKLMTNCSANECEYPKSNEDSKFELSQIPINLTIIKNSANSIKNFANTHNDTLEKSCLATTTFENKQCTKEEASSDLNKSKSSKGRSAPSLVSTNFVRINIKKKVFTRKSRNGNYLRKKVFRKKLAKKGYCIYRNKSSYSSSYKSSNTNICFKCGEHGHWANKCNKSGFHSSANQANISKENEDNFCLESAADILNSHNLSLSSACMIQENSNPNFHNVTQASPLFKENSYIKEEVSTVLKQFGYMCFRPGQEKAIHRILCGKPTLIVLSTGMGKSLCYQLPAFMYSQKRKSITLVVSPLVSLMDDQVSGLPKFLKAACLHSGMTNEQREKTLEQIQDRKFDILLISPEAITSWAGMSSYTSPFSKLPPISFVCIDECHCLSEWSHSFRPSYLRVCKVLKEQLGIHCLVGLTATCTMSSCTSIVKQLGIFDDKDGIIINTSLPENLVLSISRDRYKDEALISLLTSDRFISLQSIIIYCTRRDEAARLSSYLRTSLQNKTPNEELISDSLLINETETSSKKRKATSAKGRKSRCVSWEVDCYHAGMSPAERRKVQKKFMNGQLKVVVATVAFGMGIDKHNVRAVIHYNMPRSFERYVQEVGRAGRDGCPAQCHTFIDCQGGDLAELGRHIYTKTVDRFVVKQLVKKVFKFCDCLELNRSCPGHFSAIPIDATVEELDLPREGIETFLCYLELDSLVKVFPPTRTNCLLHCYEGPRQMALVAKKCPAVAVALANKGSDVSVTSDLQFSIDEVANHLHVDVFTLQKSLRSLMWDTSLSKNVSAGRSGVTVEFTDISFLVKTMSETSNSFLDDVTDSLHKRVLQQEVKELEQLQICFDTLQKNSFFSVSSMPVDEFLSSKSNDLKSIINDYFASQESDVNVSKKTEPTTVDDDVRSSIRQFLHIYGTDIGNKLTGRAVARILHGIESPRYPARTWGTVRRFWRSCLTVPFNALVKAATDELLAYR